MKRNIGTIDRLIRLLIGLTIIAVGYVNGSWWGLLGMVPIITAVTGFCGYYFPFGFSTRRLESDS